MNDIPGIPLLLSSTELEPLLDNERILILDVSSADNYARGHIPGAIHLSPEKLVCGIQPATGKLPNREHLSKLFGYLGLEPDKIVIAYDDEGGGWAGRLIWTLDAIGHPHHAYLDGGILAWRSADKPISTSPTAPTSTHYEVDTIKQNTVIACEELMSLLSDDSLAIWDVRSPEEFDGTKVNAQRGGHIPGAINYEWTEMMDKNNSLQLLPLETIQAKLNTLGITKDKQVITHCQTHHRSGLSYLVAKLLDYPNIRAYDGSWSEWGNRLDTPIVNVTP